MSTVKRKALYIRVPEDLRLALVEQASGQGVSLNTLLVALLAGSIGFTLDSPSDAHGNADSGGRQDPVGRQRARRATTS